MCTKLCLSCWGCQGEMVWPLSSQSSQSIEQDQHRTKKWQHTLLVCMHTLAFPLIVLLLFLFLYNYRSLFLFHWTPNMCQIPLYSLGIYRETKQSPNCHGVEITTMYYQVVTSGGSLNPCSSFNNVSQLQFSSCICGQTVLLFNLFNISVNPGPRAWGELDWPGVWDTIIENWSQHLLINQFLLLLLKLKKRRQMDKRALSG